MNHAPSREQILDDLRGILQNFNGREYDGEIGRHTKFVADLGMASIEALVLIETLEQHYDRELDFRRAFADKTQTKVVDLEVGDLVDFLYDELRQPTPDDTLTR